MQGSCVCVPLLQTCQLAVVTSPRDSHALGLLGLAQLAQYDNNPNSDGSKEAIASASRPALSWNTRLRAESHLNS